MLMIPEKKYYVSFHNEYAQITRIIMKIIGKDNKFPYLKSVLTGLCFSSVTSLPCNSSLFTSASTLASDSISILISADVAVEALGVVVVVVAVVVKEATGVLECVSFMCCL